MATRNIKPTPYQISSPLDHSTLPVAGTCVQRNGDLYDDASKRCRRHRWLPGALVRISSVPSADGQGRNGIWRLQAAGTVRSLAGVVGRAAHHTAVVVRWSHHRRWNDRFTRPRQEYPHPIRPLSRHRRVDSAHVGKSAGRRLPGRERVDSVNVRVPTTPSP